MPLIFSRIDEVESEEETKIHKKVKCKEKKQQINYYCERCEEGFTFKGPFKKHLSTEDCKIKWKMYRDTKRERKVIEDRK